ncbi:hypothetical protein GKC30_06890 [Pseudodesulfovibrio sp. F-1]|uniref:Uncharacterized protein n=1 Tax=Pseudodesulfovibrio alkaliphilus TaxID=2661613 RepID=A0A7K1KMN9_9BACT|nr:hypothetical protein [Pseudodesulfovibrio alkaliphilus]
MFAVGPERKNVVDHVGKQIDGVVADNQELQAEAVGYLGDELHEFWDRGDLIQQSCSSSPGRAVRLGRKLGQGDMTELHVFSIIALIVMSRRAAYPKELLIPFRKSERLGFSEGLPGSGISPSRARCARQRGD